MFFKRRIPPHNEHNRREEKKSELQDGKLCDIKENRKGNKNKRR